MKFNQKGMDALLNLASKKFGTTPENLKEDLEKGKLDGVFKGMNTSEKQKLQETLSNKEMLNKVMNSPEAQNLIKKLSGQK